MLQQRHLDVAAQGMRRVVQQHLRRVLGASAVIIPNSEAQPNQEPSAPLSPRTLQHPAHPEQNL